MKRGVTIEKKLQCLLEEENPHQWTQDEISYENDRIKGRNPSQNLTCKENSQVQSMANPNEIKIVKYTNVKPKDLASLFKKHLYHRHIEV